MENLACALLWCFCKVLSCQGRRGSPFYLAAEQAQHGQWQSCLAHLASPGIVFLHDVGITFTVERIDASAPELACWLLEGALFLVGSVST